MAPICLVFGVARTLETARSTSSGSNGQPTLRTADHTQGTTASSPTHCEAERPRGWSLLCVHIKNSCPPLGGRLPRTQATEPFGRGFDSIQGQIRPDVRAVGHRLVWLFSQSPSNCISQQLFKLTTTPSTLEQAHSLDCPGTRSLLLCYRAPSPTRPPMPELRAHLLTFTSLSCDLTHTSGFKY